MSIELPAHLGRYRLTRVRGQGAMGVVYEAEDSRLGRVVAVKTVQRNVLFDESTASDFAERFEREARAAASLSHPNIVTVYDFGEHDGSSYIVMELVRGRELAQSFDAGQRPSLRESVRIVAELLDALDYAHRQGVVHRDIKPANVMLDETGRVKLTDFGVARVATTAQERTMPGTQVGTPSYMAPEQILGTAVGSRADIFAAGVVLYQCLTGQRPFSGGGAFQIQRQIVQDDPRPPSSLVSELPPTMDGVVARALAKRPEDRYQTAAQFAADLRATLGAEATDPGLPAPAEHDPDATIVMRPGAWPLAGLRATPAGAAPGSTGLRSGAGVGPGTAPSATRSTAAGHAPTSTGPRAASFEPTQVASRRPAIPPAERAAGGTAAAPSAPGSTAAMRAPTVAHARAKASPKVAALVGAALLVALLVAAAFAWRSWSPAPPSPTRGDPGLTSAPAPAKPPPSTTRPAQREGSDAGPAPAVVVPGPAAPTSPAPASAAPVTSSPPATVAPRTAPTTSSLPPPPAARPRPAPERASPAPTVVRRAPASPDTAPTPRDGTRCAVLLQRMQLGEVLLPSDDEYFQRRCSR